MGGTISMDATTEKQQTMTEFMRPSKALRVWQIILAALVSLMLLGAVYEFTKPKPEPVRMTHESSDDTYSYLDVLLLSDWVYQVSGDENYTFYEAMDPDGNWFLVSLDEKTFAPLKQHVDAYNAYFTDDYMNYSYPEPTRLSGMPTYISYDDTQELSSYYNISFTEFGELFGANYLNEGVSNASVNAVLYLTGMFIPGLFLLAIVLQGSAVKRNYRKSEDRLYALGVLDDAEAAFSSPESVRFEKSKLVLSKQFVFSGGSGYVLPYEDIGWTYLRTQRSYGIAVGKQIMAGLVNGKTVALASRAVNDQVLTTAAQAIYSANPNCLIGYSFDNIKLYNERVKEYKRSHPN